MLDRLPIYRVVSEDADHFKVIDYARRIFHIKDDFQLSRGGNSRVLRKDGRVLEIADASGGVWAADEPQLWKPVQRPKLPSDRAAVAEAERITAVHQLLPRLDGPFHYGSPATGGTWFAFKDVRTGRRENRRLDIQVTYPVFVDELPVIGGGGDFKITFGDQSAVIAYSGVWRMPQTAFEAKLLERTHTDEQFRALTEEMQVESFDASLAYYSAPAFQEQEFLYPVYVYRGTAVFGQQRVPLRQIVVPATEFGPPDIALSPQQARNRRRSTYIRRAGTLPAGALAPISRRSYRTATSFEAGTSWIGLSGGLSGSESNAQGFVDEWATAGWKVNFNWGDVNAWESDWTSEDDTWVDAADFVFYTGHASMDGWVLASTGGDGFLHFSEAGANPASPGDHWGQNDLEWTIIAACGPLQDDVISAGGGDVFDRWAGAFDGLHILMGYGAITFDNTDEGRRIAQYAKNGETLIDSWFRTAQEIQPSTNGAAPPDGPAVWVGAMWVGNDESDPAFDHAWGFGSVSADPTSPTWYAAMWTTC